MLLCRSKDNWGLKYYNESFFVWGNVRRDVVQQFKLDMIKTLAEEHVGEFIRKVYLC